MGFTSSLCGPCGHPLLSAQATTDINRWMTQAVALGPDGSIHAGEYDGYGRVGGAEDAALDATVYHRACWEKAGRPLDYQGASADAPDQGWFFNDGEHDMPEPKVPPAPGPSGSTGR